MDNTRYKPNNICTDSIRAELNGKDLDKLVPDDTVYKGTNKHNKMDEKSTHFAVHISPSIFDSKINKSANYTQHPLKSSLGYIFFNYQG